MFDAQLIIANSTVYSPWFPRGGDNLIVTLEVVAISGATIKIEVFTKNTEETGDGADADTSLDISTTGIGRESEEWPASTSPGLKQLVRYKITVTGNSPNWVLFRLLDPIWFDSVTA